jgi:hypothetical protein
MSRHYAPLGVNLQTLISIIVDIVQVHGELSEGIYSLFIITLWGIYYICKEEGRYAMSIHKLL